MLSTDVERLLQQRYYQPGEDWSALVWRVVGHVCSDESTAFRQLVYEQIYDRVWLPNSPCLVNAGLKNGGMMACFVVGPDEDTLEGHVSTLGDIAAVGKRGGGAGFSGANIRPEASPVAGSAHGYAYGPNAWATRVSEYLDMITQGGFRKMALMYSLPAEHADIKNFIKLKHNGDESFAYNFNQSVFASDGWMEQAIDMDTSHIGIKTTANVPQTVLRKMAHLAHANGEPGLLFATRINEDTPYKTCACPEIQTTNPCGEQPLPSYGSCNLGSINLAHDIFYDANDEFNFVVLDSVVTGMTRFLDNIGSKNVFPNDKFKDWYEKHRPIGIGVMGYADALLRQKMTYGKEDGLRFIEHTMHVIRGASYRASEKLGRERGVPEHCRAVNRRNITTVSIAPTGSIAFIAGCSHGIEPVFSPVFQRTDERGETYLFKHPARNESFFRSSLNDDKLKAPTWKEHIDVQAAAQVFVDSGVSKTINMFNGVSVDEIYEAFIYAWQKGCKGITIYRDGSRDNQVLENIKEEDAESQACPTGICST